MSTLQCDDRTFLSSRTCEGLIRAALEEHHARRAYAQAARTLEDAGLYVIAHAFRFTAAQEKEHGDVLRGLLSAYGGRPCPLVEDAPILLPRDPLNILRDAAQGEQTEAEQLYPACAQAAEAEGYPRIASALRRIPETEMVHARRFRQYAEALEAGRLFRAPERVGWLCLPCGQLRYGQEAPCQCSTCGRAQGGFIRSDFYPFVVE